MDPRPLLGEHLSALIQQAGNTCLTVLCPLHPANPDRSSDRISIKHLAQQAALLISTHWPTPTANRLQNELESLIDQLDLVRPPKGLGIYLNEHFHLVEAYPFAVPPVVLVDDRFPVRESLWLIQQQKPYYVLSLSEHFLQLAEIRDGEWKEVRDHFFPASIRDDFAYATPARSSSYAGHAHVKSFERDKSELQHKRLQDAFRSVDTPLAPYLMNNGFLILAGAERDMSLFRQITQHGASIIAQVNGNYQIAHQELFQDKIEFVIRDHQHTQMQRMVSAFQERWGTGLARCGLSDCWEAVDRGQGLQLVVERGYREAMYLSPAGNFSKDKTAPGSRFLPDAVDELMQRALDKGGSVFLVDNNLLSSASRVALILRYA